MKRSILLLAFITFLILAGVGAWQWLLRKTLPPAGENRIVLATNTDVAPVSVPEGQTTFPESRAPPRIRQPEEVVGIGAILKTDRTTGGLMISGAVPNSPAAAAGLAGEFLVRKIDDISTEGMKLQECVELIRGVAGTKVRLELFNVDANQSMTVELTREKLQL